MSKAIKWLIIAAAVCTLLISVVVFNNQDKQQNVSQVGAAPRVGYKVPNFSLPVWPNNAAEAALDNYKGKPLFINFWASWCPPCQAETPDLVKAYGRYGDKVEFIGINLTSQDSEPDVQAFINRYGIKYPTLLDKGGKVANLYEVTAIPTSFFVDSKGIIVERFTGAISPEALENNLKRIAAR